jgi:hypothetical protein
VERRAQMNESWVDYLDELRGCSAAAKSDRVDAGVFVSVVIACYARRQVILKDVQQRTMDFDVAIVR